MERLASALFLLSAAFCLYTLAGYPLLLALLAARRAKPFQKRPLVLDVAVILPVRNGERWIAAKLESLLRLDYPRDRMRVLVISDGSEDRTDEIVRAYASRGNIELLRVPRGGKAAALNAGIQRAGNADVLFFTDVRQDLDPSSLRNLVECFADPAVGAASGELVIREGESREEANVGLYWRYEKWIRGRLSRIDSVLGATGCIYAMRRALAVPLPSGTLVDDMYLPLAAFFRGYRVLWIDSARAYDYPAALQTEFRRKVRTLAGVYQIIGAYPALLGPGNRMWLHFVSHKLARLLLPYALLTLIATAFWLPAPWDWLAIAAQACFYALALVDLWIPESWLLKRLSSPCRTFVVLMAAALSAVSIVFLPGQSLWKETR